MSYAMSAALQTAIYQHLASDTVLDGLIGGAIYDAVPPATPPGTFVLLGPEEARDKSDQTGAGAEHVVTISVVTDASGFLAAKTVAAQVSDRLVDAPLILAQGRLVGIWFDRADARKVEKGKTRRIDLRFRARLEA
jgi:hypothetical protein